jgi:antitoxin FitA
MATLTIRNVDDALHARLKESALAHHRSLEEEVRETLRMALARRASHAPAPSLVAIIDDALAGAGLLLDLPSRADPLERPPLDFRAPDFGR